MRSLLHSVIAVSGFAASAQGGVGPGPHPALSFIPAITSRKPIDCYNAASSRRRRHVSSRSTEGPRDFFEWRWERTGPVHGHRVREAGSAHVPNWQAGRTTEGNLRGNSSAGRL